MSGGFLQQGLLDELIVYQAPCLLGNATKPMVDFNPISLAQQLRFEYHHHERIGNDMKLTLLPCY